MPDMERWLAMAIGLRGWRRIAAVFSAGVFSALALAPFYLLPLLLLGFSLLVFFLDDAAASSRPLRSAFFIGWQFGFGYFLIGLYWLGFSFFVQAEQFAWMAPFAIMGMPAFLASFTGAACSLSVRFWTNGWPRIVAFAVAWSVFEYARGHVLTGLPWNLVGQSFAGLAAGGQLAAFFGAYGLSLLVLLIACLPALFGAANNQLLKGLVLSGAAAMLVFSIGAIRLAATPKDDHENVALRIVQPNIPQRKKIDPNFWWENFEKQRALSENVSPAIEKTFVIWPENSVPVLNEASDALNQLGEVLPRNAVLVAGSVRRTRDERGIMRYYNAIAFIADTPAGRQAVGFYDKHHLVPFGEYLPLQGFLRAIGLAQLAPFDDGFTPGGGPTIVDLGGPKFAPLICYEAIFPGQMHPKGDRPEWLLTVTNDAWFGDTSGPRQHLDQARLRSIETGLPMARSANTGISAVIDGVGRYRARLPLYEAGVIDAPLPKPIAPTLYARFGDLPYFGLVLIGVAAVAARRDPANLKR